MHPWKQQERKVNAWSFFASFAPRDGQWPHPQHCHLHAPAPLNITAHNTSPKFCPNDYISKDLLLSTAAWKRLEDQFCTSCRSKSILSCHNVLFIIIKVRTHTHTLFLSLPHTQAHSVFRQSCARHVLSAFGQLFIVPWSRCHFTLHWPPSN